MLLSLVALLLNGVAVSSGVAQEAKVHKVVLHVDDSDPDRMNLVLNNASNINAYYQDKGEEAKIEIVTYGPGLNMLIAGQSPVAERVKSMAESFDSVSFKACNNTLQGMIKKTGKDIKLLPQAAVVPSGVIHLIERQEQGWSYLRP
jgi:intracellular sulfur oxidation DsrE/DsrF family protein